ncbi:unnamed protein product [Periconia digitata]|uniref:Secreted protein n=1 Tax=Periconia digitata TaxID=1303443 RepID=A0A9W4U208_9PLEO|nr:unnamed protein product [Periconia digitata]
MLVHLLVRVLRLEVLCLPCHSTSRDHMTCRVRKLEFDRSCLSAARGRDILSFQ